MKENRAVTIVLAVLLVVLVGGMIGLAAIPMKPAVRTIEQTLPDDHIPH